MNVTRAIHEPDRARAITAVELAAHAAGHGTIDAGELERWLVDGRLAERTPAGLVPTARAVDIAGGIDLAPVFSG